MKGKKDLNLKDNKSIKEMDLDSIKKELVESKKRYFVLKMKLKTDELKQTHLLKPLRKYIATLHTFIWQK